MWRPRVQNTLRDPYGAIKDRVGHDSLVGEVIRIEADKATVQVYEETGKGIMCCLALGLRAKLMIIQPE